MRTSRILAFVIAFLLIGTNGFAGDQRTVVRFSFPITAQQILVGQCSGFEIWSDFAAVISLMRLYDNDGNLVQGLNLFRIIGESVYYNSTDASKAVSGGPGEVELARLEAATGVIEAHGLTWKVRIPGHGLILVESGTYVLQCDPYTFANCVMVSNVGHNQVLDGDFAALCDALD